MVNKKLIKTIALATSAGAITFFGYKVYITYKDIKSRAVDTEAELEALEALKTQEVETNFGEDEEEDDNEQGNPYGYENVIDMPGVVREHLQPTPHIFEDVPEADEDIAKRVGDIMQGSSDVVLDTVQEPDQEDTENGYTRLKDKEVEELRYPPNSAEANTQYKEMLLSDFKPTSSARITLWHLFNQKFVPTNHSDGDLVNKMIDARIEFFGTESIYILVEEVSVAELILYYANMLDYDLDGGVDLWASNILSNTYLDRHPGFEEEREIISKICNHAYVGENGYGIFGLDNVQYQDAVTKIHGSKMTFNAQFHAFLTSELALLEDDE